MRRVDFLFLPLFFLLISTARATGPDWSEGVAIPPSGRENILELPDSPWKSAIAAGRKHALTYPVETTALMPYEPLRKFFDVPSEHLFKRFLRELFGAVSPWDSMDEMFRWVGLHAYPETAASGDATGIYDVPYPTAAQGQRPEYRMGASLIATERGVGLTFSCATCHSADLFGKRVIGMTNRFPRANEYLNSAGRVRKVWNPHFFQSTMEATDGETAMADELLRRFRWIEGRDPAVLGLDTSLAQVALSLSKRGLDPYAELDLETAKHPRESLLREQAADSKPAVWWNLKYKNRWLSDGSVVAGNPIFTNFLWNEIGRGADLRKLEGWLDANQTRIDELTAAVFASQAPRYTDFFPASEIRIERAVRGERVFLAACSRCHGVYDKAWNLPSAPLLSPDEKLATVRVRYHKKTPVVDVGTDPLRHQGMKALETELNRLAISKAKGIVVRQQKGYVPPPLVGIWARWPYFHNNSAPSLCAVLTRGDARPTEFDAGPAEVPWRDFDPECNGYPLGDSAPPFWATDFKAAHYDTRKPGLSNRGHDEGIFLKNGIELLSAEQKWDLIEFMKTL